MPPVDTGDSAERLSPGMRIGPYEITDFLGAGGMGEVYLSELLGRRVRTSNRQSGAKSIAVLPVLDLSTAPQISRTAGACCRCRQRSRQQSPGQSPGSSVRPSVPALACAPASGVTNGSSGESSPAGKRPTSPRARQRRHFRLPTLWHAARPFKPQ
jgi:hypothetical protein